MGQLAMVVLDAPGDNGQQGVDMGHDEIDLALVEMLGLIDEIA